MTYCVHFEDGGFDEVEGDRFEIEDGGALVFYDEGDSETLAGVASSDKKVRAYSPDSWQKIHKK